MIIELILNSVISALLAFLITRKVYKDRSHVFIHQAKQKARAIEQEAQKYFERQKRDIERTKSKLEDKYEEKTHQLQLNIKKELRYIHDTTDELNTREEHLKIQEKDIHAKRSVLDNIEKHYNKKLTEVLKILELSSDISCEDARSIILKRTEEQAQTEISYTLRKAEVEAKELAKKKANYIIAQATTRYAGEFIGERLINNITLTNNEIKGRIIGKEGRNIKTLETILNVDIIIDDTPNVITISCFNLYRRAIAKTTLERLIEDGNIQPMKIEQTHQKVCQEYETIIFEDGKNVILDLDIGYVSDELTKLVGKLKYRASYGQNALSHSLEVVRLTETIVAELEGNVRIAKRAALFHDIGKALTQETSGSHVDIGVRFCKKYGEDDIVINAILAHHGHEEARTIEAAAVCTADVLSAARPGARREALESFLKRMTDIENIATSELGVYKAYAVSSGREVRVIVNSEIINDAEMQTLGRKIAKKIEKTIQFPGEIHISVIRETRLIEVARSNNKDDKDRSNEVDKHVKAMVS